MTTLNLFSHPMYVMLKPIGAHCNLACNYCYYLEKANLYRDTPRHVMSEETLEKFVRQYIEAQTMNEILFTWHGGEPLMRPLSFYRKAMDLQRRYGSGHIIANSIQTNGTMLTDEWCEFFRQNNWLVGVSIDGPQEFHDEYRRMRSGKPSWIQVMRGIRLLQKHHVEWNAMAVVNDYNVSYPLQFYRFFKSIGCRYIQFTPIVERLTHHDDGRKLAGLHDDPSIPVAPFSVSAKQWGDFCCAVFDEWVKNDVGQTFIQLFDATLANWCNVTPGLCTMGKTCGHAAVMEFNGDVYSCDHFVFPPYKLGNIRNHTLLEMMYGERQRTFASLKQQRLPRQCRECTYAFACNGECPKNRFISDRYGNPGLNWLCQGYYRFLEHVAPYMDYMKQQIDQGLPPAGIVGLLKSSPGCFEKQRKS